MLLEVAEGAEGQTEEATETELNISCVGGCWSTVVRKMTFFGHVMMRQGLETFILSGKLEGRKLWEDIMSWTELGQALGTHFP